jgi:hypothetical protein
LLKGPAVEPQKEQRSAIDLRARTDVRQMLRGSRPPVSSLSAAIPYAASRRTAVLGSVTLVSRADVVPCKAATDLAKGRAWPDTEEVTGSNPVAPTIYLLSRAFVDRCVLLMDRDRRWPGPQRQESASLLNQGVLFRGLPSLWGTHSSTTAGSDIHPEAAPQSGRDAWARD